MNDAVHPQLSILLPKLQALEQALIDSDPKMPTHLREIHKSLLQYEELSHMLTDEQCALIVEAQAKQVGVMLAVETKKGTGKSSGPKLKGLTAEDL